MTQGTTKGVPIDTDPTLGLNSNQVVPSQAAVVSYVSTHSAVSITGNTGGALSPSAGNWNILGSGSITTSGVVSTLTIALTSGGFTWTDATSATQALVAQEGYITDRGGGVTYTLPASGALGDIIKIVGKAGIAVITPRATQQIVIGSTTGLAGVTGTATANNAGDCIELVCITSGTAAVWRASSTMGTWTLVTS